jgi:hypothetical protein
MGARRFVDDGFVASRSQKTQLCRYSRKGPGAPGRVGTLSYVWCPESPNVRPLAFPERYGPMPGSNIGRTSDSPSKPGRTAAPPGRARRKAAREVSAGLVWMEIYDGVIGQRDIARASPAVRR